MTEHATLTKQVITRHVSQVTGHSNRVVAEILDKFIALMSDQLAAGKRIELQNFLVLEVETITRTSWPEDDIGPGDPRITRQKVVKVRPSRKLRTRLRNLAGKA